MLINPDGLRNSKHFEHSSDELIYEAIINNSPQNARLTGFENMLKTKMFCSAGDASDVLNTYFTVQTYLENAENISNNILLCRPTF